MSSLLHFPDEIIIEICMHIGTLTDYLSLLSTCRRIASFDVRIHNIKRNRLRKTIVVNNDNDIYINIVECIQGKYGYIYDGIRRTFRVEFKDRDKFISEYPNAKFHSPNMQSLKIEIGIFLMINNCLVSHSFERYNKDSHGYCLDTESTFSRGVIHGISIGYHNGRVSYITRYHRGLEHGTCIGFNHHLICGYSNYRYGTRNGVWENRGYTNPTDKFMEEYCNDKYHGIQRAIHNMRIDEEYYIHGKRVDYYIYLEWYLGTIYE